MFESAFGLITHKLFKELLTALYFCFWFDYENISSEVTQSDTQTKIVCFLSFFIFRNVWFSFFFVSYYQMYHKTKVKHKFYLG